MSNFNKPQNPTRRSQSTLAQFMAVVFLILMAIITTQAQEPTATPAPSPSAIEKEIERLKKEKEKAELEKAIRDSQPQPSSTPLEGKTTVDENVIIETQMVTYKALSDVAERIGSEIQAGFPSAKSIAIYDADELQNLKHYRAASPVLEGRIESLKQRYSDIFAEISMHPELQALTVQTETSKTSNNLIKSTTSSNVNTLTATTGVTTAAGGAVMALKAFADLLALMRTDTEIKGKSVTVEESAMVAETFRALRNKFKNQIKLYYPSVVAPEADFEGCPVGSTRKFCSPILSSLGALYAKKEEAEKKLLNKFFDISSEFEKMTRKKTGAAEEITALSKQIDDLNLDRLKQELKKPWTRVQISKFEMFIKALEVRKAAAVSAKTEAAARLETLAKQKNLLEALQTANQQADEMVAALAKPDDKGKSQLANFLRAENMNQALGNDGLWLEFRAISAGGNNRTRKNLFRYFSGAKLDHSGGVIIEWALYDRNGVSVESNKDSSYPGYFAPKEIRSGKLQDAVADPRRPETPAVAKSGDQ